MTYPSTQNALKIDESYHLQLVETPVLDELLPTEMLLKVVVAGVNHVDNYFLDYKWSIPGFGSGVSMSGVVMKVGSRVTRFQIGDTAASFTFAGDANNPDHGAFQEYARVLESNSIKFHQLKLSEVEDNGILPSGMVQTFEGAASIVGNCITLGVSVFHCFGNNDGPSKTILVYGGSTGMGQLTIQYCHHIGWKVIAIASLKNEEYLKELGADVVIDYHTDSLFAIIQDLNEDIDYYYLTAGGKRAMSQVYQSIPLEKQGIKLESLEVPDIKFIKDQKPNVEFGFTRAFTAHGVQIFYGNGSSFRPRPGILKSMQIWVPIVENLLQEGIIKHPRIRIWPNGLQGVNEALDFMKRGEFSNMRVVVKVATSIEN